MQKFKTILFITILLCGNYLFAQTLILQKEVAHEGGVNTISLSNDGFTLLSGGNDTKTYLWNIKTFEKLKGALKHNEKVTAVAISENNKFYISGSSDSKIRFFDLELNLPTRILSEHTAEITKLAINPINSFFASASKDNSIKIWDNTKSKASLFTLKGHQNEITGLSFSPDGKILISISLDNTLKVWDANTGELKQNLEIDLKGLTAFTYSTDKKYVFVGGNNGKVLVVDGTNFTKIKELNGFKSEIKTLAVSGDGQFLAIAGKDKNVFIFNIESGKIVNNFSAHEQEITDLAFNQQGDVLITAGLDGFIKTWNVKNLNIGTKQFVKSENEHIIVSSNFELKDENQNGIIEPSEKTYLQFNIQNDGKTPAINALAKLNLVNPNTYIKFDKDIVIGNIEAGKKQTVKIPLIVSPDLQVSSNSFNLNILDANKDNVEPLKLNFQTSASKGYSYIKVEDYQFASATGKAEIGAPITLKLKLKNISKGIAKDIKVNFVLPDKVLAVNKLTESIASISPEEVKEVHIEFYADKSFTSSEIKIEVDIQGAAFSNTKELEIGLKLNEKLPNSHQNQPNEIVNVNDKTVVKHTSKTEDIDFTIPTNMNNGKFYALIIGVSNYEDKSIATLDKPITDAIALQTVLTQNYSFENDKVKVLKNPTRKDIFKEFTALQALSKEDNLLVFYAGHGYYNPKEQQGYWLPSDAEKSDPANWISNSDIKDRLRGIDCKHTLLISDACFSGGLFKTRKAFEDANNAINEVYKLPSRKAMTSGTLTEVPDKSVFIEYLLKRLQSNTEKYLSSQKLFSSMQEAIINNSSVIPQWGTITETGDEGGDFIFVKK